MNYQKSLNKSTNKKKIRIGSKNYILDTKKFKKFKMNILAITTSVALTITAYGLVKDNVKFHFEKENINFNVVEQMQESGYQAFPVDGDWNYRYDKLDNIDAFDLLIYMGADDALDVIQYRGYESWEDLAQKEGYEDKYEWYNAQKEEVINKDTKTRGGK
ncbi:MAG: hypothetical protein PHW32_04660 [Bacilli bacterium]|nr:hypothetical protein [Bacilli bacterium]MDD4283031.1 hypothetical protein [Bacilli bacterium]MDD4718591.1 hypothetical protein [Bacilli bacterium]